MWWVYVKACWRALLSATGLGGITFKTTLKGASAFVDGAVRDLWLPGVAFGALAASAIAGAVKLFSGPTLASPLAISVLWAFYGAVPSFLAIYYGAISKGPSLAAVCRLAMVTGLSAGTLAVFLMWGLAPQQYDYEGVAEAATAFFDARRVGKLPPSAPAAAASAASAVAAAAAAALGDNAPWRGDALLQEAASPVLSVASAVVAAANNLTFTPLSGVADVSGGWLNGGGAGNLKLTSTTAFAVALLSWARMTFPGAAATALEGRRTNDAARWGADWLMKASEVGTGGLLNTASAAAAAAAAVDAASTTNNNNNATTSATTPTPAPPSSTIDLSSGYGGDLLVAQVGNATVDALFWGRPEDITGPRPAFAVSLSLGAADLAGAAAAALAAASTLWKADDPAWSSRALARAESLFAAAQLYPGLSQDQLQAGREDHHGARANHQRHRAAADDADDVRDGDHEPRRSVEGRQRGADDAARQDAVGLGVALQVRRWDIVFGFLVFFSLLFFLSLSRRRRAELFFYNFLILSFFTERPPTRPTSARPTTALSSTSTRREGDARSPSLPTTTSGRPTCSSRPRPTAAPSTSGRGTS